MQVLLEYFSKDFEPMEAQIIGYLNSKKILTPKSSYWGTSLKDILLEKNTSPHSRFIDLFGQAPDKVITAFSNLLIYTFISEGQSAVRKYAGSTDGGVTGSLTTNYLPVASGKMSLKDSWLRQLSEGGHAIVSSSANIRSSGDISAFASNPPAINWWDSIPSASSTVRGGIILGSGLSWNSETGKVDVTAIGGFEGDHNDLSGLNVGNYIHLTAAQYANVDNWDSAYSYISDALTNLTQDYIPYAYSASKLLRDSIIKQGTGQIEVEGDILSSGDISAFASDPPAINWWDNIPSASSTVRGGIVLGDGLAWNGVTGKVDVTGIGGGSFDGDHNDLSGLNVGDYVHLTAAQYANVDNWDDAYSLRLQWDGGSTNLVAATARTSLGLGDLALLDTVNTDQIDDGAVTLGKIEDLLANRILGRITTAGVTQQLEGSDVRTIAGADLVDGRILFGKFAQDSGLLWDNTNKRLGVNLTPTGAIHAKATSGATLLRLDAGGTSDNTALYFCNSAGTLRAAIVYRETDAELAFFVNGADRMEIYTDGTGVFKDDFEVQGDLTATGSIIAYNV